MHFIQPIRLSNDGVYCCSTLGYTTIYCLGDAYPINSNTGIFLIDDEESIGYAEFGVCCAVGVSFNFQFTDNGGGAQEVTIGAGSYIMLNDDIKVDLEGTYSEGSYEFEVDCEVDKPCGNVFIIYVTGCHVDSSDPFNITVDLETY